MRPSGSTALFAEAGAEQPEWQPILLGGLFKRFDRDSWADGPGQRGRACARCERRASAYGLPPIRWPEPFPGNTLHAMRVATYAKEIGRVVSFSLAAFRQAFAAGPRPERPRQRPARRGRREMHPRAIEAAVGRDAVKDALREATDRAGDLGVVGVPTIVVGDEVFWGDDRLEDAVAAAAEG